MGKTTVGKLREILVLETEQDGELVIVAFPKGCIVEVSSEEEYQGTTTTQDIENAVHFLDRLTIVKGTYKNIKNRIEYLILDDCVVNATNNSNGEVMILYENSGQRFVREISEFGVKFTKV